MFVQGQSFPASVLTILIILATGREKYLADRADWLAQNLSYSWCDVSIPAQISAVHRGGHCHLLRGVMVGVINRLPTLGVLAVAVIAVNLYDVSCLACVYTCRIWDICQWCADPAGEICSVPCPMPLVSCFFSTISFLGFRASSQDHQAHLLRRSVSFALAAVEISGPENIQKPQKNI